MAEKLIYRALIFKDFKVLCLTSRILSLDCFAKSQELRNGKFAVDYSSYIGPT